MKSLARLTDIFGRSSEQDATACTDVERKPQQPTASKSHQTHTISLRVTDAEKKRLERDAAGMSRSAYMRERLFGSSAQPRKTRGKHPVKDYEALGRVLGLLGRSQLANDLNELNWAVENGTVKIDAATALAIKMACVDVAAMRSELVIALGLKTERAL